MCCKNSKKRIIPFVLTFLLGLLLADSIRKENLTENAQNISQKVSFHKALYSEGRGLSGRKNVENLPPFFVDKPLTMSSAGITPLQIISKPKPNYTEAARQNQTQGKINLQVTFQADGQIGKIWVISGLPEGLTEQAVSAAKQIKFKPLIADGTPKTVSKTVQYNFTIS